ncbi:MAG TPA: DUF2378 family protein [Gemmatimonadaceae bacterium]|nr:DUF2378 family protein [Gemmatimonadaceae bacterium]
MQQIKGSVLKSRLGFVEEIGGPDAVKRVLAALGEEDRKALGSVLTVKWYPMDLGTRLDHAIVQVLGGGSSEYFERLGAASADRNLTTVHKAFVTTGDPHGFLARTPAIYSLYYEKGRREYQKTGEKTALLTTYDAEVFSAPDCLTVVGWHKRALEMCGATGVRVHEEECRARGGSVCRYKLSWS